MLPPDPTDLFVSLAEIAGVFVGFGALIALTRRDDVTPGEAMQLRGVVLIGLLVMVASLVPVLLASFGFAAPALWRVSSVVFLALIWTLLLLAISRGEREQFLAAQRETPRAMLLFWGGLEIPIQLSLLANVVGFRPELAPAFYATALVVNVGQAAFLLALLVILRRELPANR